MKKAGLGMTVCSRKKPVSAKVSQSSFWLTADREGFEQQAREHFNLEPQKMSGVQFQAAKRHGLL